MRLNDIKKEVKFWQRLLRLAGYYTGAIDGIKGALQINAERLWQEAVELAKKELGEFDLRTEQNLESLIPEAQAEARQWLAKAIPTAAKNWNLTLKVICGTRSYAEQDALYEKRPKVTNAKGGYSNHNFGLAFDIALFDFNGNYLTKDNYYDKLANAVPVGDALIWGGSWKFHDAPHYQLSKYGSTTAGIRKIFNA